MSDMQNILSNLRKKYERSYGFAVFDLDVEENEDTVVVRGEVLTEKQKEEAISEIKNACGKKVEDSISVLGDVNSQEIGWASVKADIVDLKSRFVPTSVMNGRILKRICVTQAEKGEVLRVLFQKENQILVQSGDLTLGWVDSADVDLQQESLRDKWRGGTVAVPDELIPVDFSEENFINAAEKFLGVKYILGAKSGAAIDCSGFTQTVYKNAFNIILPKHSWDQKKLGAMVGLSEAETGDLVFMKNGETATKHVGIWEKLGDRGNIIHASHAFGKVIRQSADEVFEKYDLAEVRRIVKK